MNAIKNLLVMMVVVFSVLVGCEQAVSEERPVKMSAVAGNEYIGLWDVSFLDVEYDAENDVSIFRYSVSSVSERGKDLSHWVLELCDEAVVVGAKVNGEPYPIGSDPIHVDPTTQMLGFKFDDGQPLGSSWEYEIVLAGHLDIVDGQFSLKAGSNQNELSVSYGSVQAPSCEPVVNEEKYSISGVVFMDVNGNGLFDAGEFPIPGVQILLNGSPAALSGIDGSYLIDDLVAGSYEVVSYPAGGAPELQAIVPYLIPVLPESVQVVLGPSKSGVDFAYRLDYGDVLLSGEGRTIGFWKHQLSVIISGKGKAQVSKAQIDAMIGQINGFFLPDPFAIGSYKQAFEILSNSSPVPVDLLKKQLLAAEFNKFYGLGLDSPLLMEVILKYAESMVYLGSFSGEELLSMKDVLDAMNNLGH
ncbi:MAG TPA: SdrD B-like domain-containing protein [bacterium]|nr:SdrD B-like domain-containing protein [bacterium]